MRDDKKEKSFDFAKVFTALGISVDLRNFAEGRIFFSNTEKRVADLKAVISVLDGQLFGRLGKFCLTEVTRHACEATSDAIDRRCRLALIRFLARLESNAGRRIML